jgi:hypothetical protein
MLFKKYPSYPLLHGQRNTKLNRIQVSWVQKFHQNQPKNKPVQSKTLPPSGILVHRATNTASLTYSACQFTICEPIYGTKRKSPITTYLELNEGVGFQHLALASEGIFKTLREMRKRSGVGGFDSKWTLEWVKQFQLIFYEPAPLSCGNQLQHIRKYVSSVEVDSRQNYIQSCLLFYVSESFFLNPCKTLKRILDKIYNVVIF